MIQREHVRRRPVVGGQCRIELLDRRLMLAAHVVGSTASYSTIQAAVNAAPAGGTVTVDAGTYAEQVTVRKTLTIKGARAGVDGRGSGRPTATASTESVVVGGSSAAFHILANDVTIDGFTVSGETGQDLLLGAGIVIGPGQSGTHVVNDVVRNNVSGLFLANGSATDGALIQHNYFDSNNNAGANGGRGIYTDETLSGGRLTNVTIDGNTFVNNRGGAGTTTLEAAVAFESATAGSQTNLRITNNTFTANGKAMLFFNSSNVVIQGNTATGSLDHWSGTLRFEGNDGNVQILFNTIYANTGPALSVDSKGVPGDDYGFTVHYNNFYGNDSYYRTPISVAVNFDQYKGTFDAAHNYWGSTTGPGGWGSGTGDLAGGGAYGATGWTLSSTVTSNQLLLSPWLTTAVSITTPTPTATTTYVSDLKATSATTGWGTVQYDDSVAGNPITLRGKVYGKGIGTHAVSTLTYALAGKYATFTSDVGVDDEEQGLGAVDFKVIGDGKTLYDSGVLTGKSAVAHVSVSVAGVKTLQLVATNGVTGDIDYDHADWAGAALSIASTSSPTTTATAAVTLTTLKPTSATVGWGTLQTNANISGTPIKLRGTTYATGLGAHAPSTITYALAGAYTLFTVDVGVDDDTNGGGSVDFQVIADGKVLFDSGVVTGKSAVVHVSVNLTGVQTLTLKALPGVTGSISGDHADWANPLLMPVAGTK